MLQRPALLSFFAAVCIIIAGQFFIHQCAGQVANSQLQSQLEEFVTEVKTTIEALPADDPDKSPLLARIKLVSSSLLQNVADANEITKLRMQTQSAKTENQRVTELISELKKEDFESSTAFSSLDIVELQTQLVTVNAKINQLQSAQTQFNAVPKSKDNADTEQATLSKQLDVVAAELDKAPSVDDSIVNRVIFAELKTRQNRLTTRQELIQLQEQRTIAYKQFDLDQKQVELASLQLARQQKIAESIETAITKLRKEEAVNLAAEASETAKQIQRKYPALAASEQFNLEFANEVQTLEAEAAAAASENSALAKQLADITEKFRDTRAWIAEIGSSNTIGAMLRKRKAELPAVQENYQLASRAREKIEEIQFKRFEISEALDELSPDVIIEEIKDSSFAVNESELQELEEPIRLLTERRRESLRAEDEILDRLFSGQFDIEANSERLANVVGKFNSYINERILWLRSNKVLFSELKIDKSDFALLSIDRWSEIPNASAGSFRKRPWLFGLAGLAFVALLAFRRTMRAEVDSLGEAAARGSCTTFWPTSRAAILTTLIAVTLPLALCGVAWAFNALAPTDSVLFDAVTQSLATAGMFAIPFEILRRACRPNGLAIKHFDWPNNIVLKLKTNLNRFVIPATIFVFAISLFVHLDSVHRVDLIERILFIASMIFTASFLYQVFSPQSGIFSHYLNQNGNSWGNQTSTIWFGAILLAPISLALLTLLGYYYTALNLTRCLCFTFAIGVGIELARGLIRRFILIRRRAAHIEAAKRKREAEIQAEREAREKAAAERQRRIEAGEDVEDLTPTANSEVIPILQPEVEIEENADQAKQLIRLLGWTAWLLGLWMVWSDVLPALKALDEYKLTGSSQVAKVEPSQVDVAGLAMMPTVNASASDDTADPNAPETDVDEKPKANAPLISLDQPLDDDEVSVRDFLVFIAIVLITFFAAKNLPNAFEMLFIEDLPVDRSARLASKSLFSYGIVILGVALALRTLSIDWTSVQWLVTALTFGLAFGLQEIFANFVAGIILMFERPMRIGDLITVDNFTGVVSRIRTRATTVVNRDRKEYIIPNKDFITGRLVNWTLSDAINRIHFNVGVAYGSDVARAKKIIFDICNNHPSIVQDPPTSITFEEFADSSLTLAVRTFLGEVESRLPVIDSLHSQINNAFNEAGIEISFPQRDLHLRTVDDQAAALFSLGERNESEPK